MTVSAAMSSAAGPGPAADNCNEGRPAPSPRPANRGGARRSVPDGHTSYQDPGPSDNDEELNDIRTARGYHDVLARLRGFGTQGAVTLVGVDGRGGSGKSTFADTLATRTEGVAIVHSDDIAWHHSLFGWHALLIDDVVVPLRRDGPPLIYRPEAWIDRGREGAITVAEGTSMVIIEGTGVCSRTVAPLLDATVWIHTNPEVAARRVVARGSDSEEFFTDWIAQEEAFLAAHEPWLRADVIINGESDTSTTSWS